MAKLKKGMFPGIVRKGRQDPTSSAITENIEILTGQRGNNRALLLSDLVDLDDMKRKALISNAGGGTNDGGLPITTGGIERPHAPVNLTAVGGFTFIAVSWDHPTYRGHAYAEIWRSETDSFGSATLIATEVADVFSDSVNMGAEFYYWVRFVNIADMKGPTQGAAGVFAETQQSAELILNEIGGQIEKSHLGTFLTSEISKIPALDFLVGDIADLEIPALKVKVDDYGIDIDSLREDVDKNLVEIPLIKESVDQTLIDIPDIQQQIAVFNDDIPELRQNLIDLTGETSEAKQTADTAKARVEAVEISSDSLARQLIESASINDTNWQSNTTKLYEFESSLKDVNARIEAEFLTKSEANEAIAAAAETIRVEIEATGLALSSDIESTYYTKATTDQAIAEATQLIKSQIEDADGDSIGALLQSQHYTKVETDTAISFSAEQLKSEIEKPTGGSLGALIHSDYYTSVETNNAIAAYGVQLKSDIENPNGDSIGATLQTNYYTSSQVDNALSQAVTNLSSVIEAGDNDAKGEITALLDESYYTSAQADNAISQATTQLNSQIETTIEQLDSDLSNDIEQRINTVNSTLTSDYYTSADTDQAIAVASQFLKSQIENPQGTSLGATLFNDYSTTVDTEKAIARAVFELNSQFDPLAESVIENALANDIANERQQVITANILRTQEAITDESNALAQSLSLIETQFNDSSARITALDKAVSNSISSSAEKIFQLDSKVESNKTYLEVNYLTKVDTQSAISEATTSLKSEVESGFQSVLTNDYYTSADTDSAITQASTQLQSSIEGVSADLHTNFYTTTETDSAISQATQLLKATIEDPDGNSVGAILFNDYSTKADVNQSISEATTQLNSNIDEAKADIYENVYTKAQADSAISQETTALKSVIDGEIGEVTADLQNNYFTKSATDTAISQATQLLKSEIEDAQGSSIGAVLFNDYSTTTQVEEAIAQATTQLNANIDDLKSDVYENVYTKANTDSAIAGSVTALKTELLQAIDDGDANALQTITADLQTNYYTQTEADSAISNATTLLKAAIEDPSGDSLGATLFNAYYTKANTDSAISEAVNAMQATIEDPNGSSIGADLQQNYSTTAETGLAISQATQQLKSAIEDPEGDSLAADIYQNFSTKTDTESAISTATTALKSTIDSDITDGDQGVKDEINADLQVNYSTTAETNTAISQAATALKSEIEDPEGGSIGATLFNDFQTKADAEEATASSSQQLRAEFMPSAQAIIENALANDLEGERRTFAEADLILNQRVLANEQTALAESVFALNASIDESKAGLYQLQTTFATKTQATAQDLLKLDSDVGNVKADLVNNYFTSAKVNEAIAIADTALRAAIEDPSGDSIGADLQTNYYTKAAADSAISSATTQLKSASEDPNGDSVGADLYVNYSTTAEVNQAISSARTALQSNIDGNKSQLETNYYTKTDTDSAISSAVTTLGSELDTELSNVNSLLQTNYYTKTQADSAISSATTQLKSTIEDPNGSSIGADLYNNFYTKTDADGAISSANQILKATIEDANGNSVGASLQTLSQTVASNEGDFSALWGVKTSVNGLQSSVGLVNDGVEPIFAVKGAKLAVITDQDPTNLTPVFAVSGGKTVINTAIIDEAFIKSLVTDDLLANRLLVGSRLTTPSINYNPSNGARSGNFSIDPNGNMLAKSATLQSVTIKDNNGDVVMSSTGAIPSSKVTGLGNLASKDSLAYDSITGKPSLGPFAGLSKILSSNVTTYIANGAIGSAQINQAYINQLFGQNASFYGTVYAENLEGDVYDSIIKSPSPVNSGSSNGELVSFTVAALPFARYVVISGIRVSDWGGMNSRFKSVSLYASHTSSIIQNHTTYGEGLIPSFTTTIPANTARTYYIRLGAGNQGAASGPVRFEAFKAGSTIS
ncbi:MAG: hypothetical protein CML20_19920 [Rheinheimera sp.]|nr:hypothetical protein [Rheinheimera sp.]